MSCPPSSYCLLQQRKLLAPDGVTGKFLQTFKEKVIPIVYELLQKIEEEEIFPNSFHESS